MPIATRFPSFVAALLASAATAQAATPPASSLATIAAFTGRGDGGYPSGLLATRSGTLFGTNAVGGGRYGLVFQLTPPASGQTQWIQSVLWDFSIGDGRSPQATPIADGNGALYGTALLGGSLPCQFGCGTVYRLNPPAAGQTHWTETTLWRFTTGDGAYPYGALLLDRGGSLYGTTSGGGTYGQGTVFKLSPPPAGGTAWSLSTLWSFAGGSDGAAPWSSLIDVGGTLYGTTTAGGAFGLGTVFSLSPPSGWTDAVERTRALELRRRRRRASLH